VEGCCEYGNIPAGDIQRGANFGLLHRVTKVGTSKLYGIGWYEH